MEYKASIYALQLEELQDWLKNEGEKPFRAGQIFEWLYEKRIDEFAEMTNLSKVLRDKLSEHFRITPLQVVTKQRAKDGTVKFLFELYDGNMIETVLMKHNYGYSVCVSTQVGCRMGCTFCASSLDGLARNLDAGEIVSQVLEVQKMLDVDGERVGSVVVMGIGEPFDNYEQVMQFIRMMNHEKGLNIGARHITVSTSGIVPKIYDFAAFPLQVNLAISLHATSDSLRSALMPMNRAYPIPELLKAVEYYIQKSGRRVTFEFGLIAGENDSIAIAEALARLVRHLNCHVNLIPINYVEERGKKRTSREKLFNFEKSLKKSGINVTIRREHGHDIDAACGQLRNKVRS